MSNWGQEAISISQLRLWDENARFPDKYFKKSEEELIEHFITKRDFKVLDLAKEIVNELDIPQLEKLVVLKMNDSNVVVEGNRRLTVYKLLAEPHLVKDPDIRQQFDALAQRSTISPAFRIDVLITESREEAERLIERKHLKANNEVGWNSPEKAHYSTRKGTADQKALMKVALVEKVKETELDPSLVDKVLGLGYVTTFERIMLGGEAKKLFGYSLDSNKSLQTTDPNFLEKLKVVILNVLEKQGYRADQKVNSRDLNKNSDIRDYLSGIDADVIRISNESISDRTITNLFGDKEVSNSVGNSRARSLPKSKDRKYLIPKTCIIPIHQNRINNIYHELRNCLPIDDSNQSVPNAVGVLFRVFLETSIDYCLDVHGSTVSKNDTISTKIPKVITLLRTYDIDEKQFAAVKRVGSSSPNVSILAIDNYHQYVHSHIRQPQCIDLKNNWDELESFFKILWECVAEKEAAKVKQKV